MLPLRFDWTWKLDSSAVDFELPPDDDPRRVEVRTWLQQHPSPSGRQLAEAGYVAPHWPKPWGLDADPVHQLIIDDELKRAGVKRPSNMIGIGWGGPTILHAGTQEQKDRYLPLMAARSLCSSSRAEAGSDLAGLARGPCATEKRGRQRPEDRTSMGHRQPAPHRPHPTRRAEAPGITYFICRGKPGHRGRPT